LVVKAIVKGTAIKKIETIKTRINSDFQPEIIDY